MDSWHPNGVPGLGSYLRPGALSAVASIWVSVPVNWSFLSLFDFFFFLSPYEINEQKQNKIQLPGKCILLLEYYLG